MNLNERRKEKRKIIILTLIGFSFIFLNLAFGGQPGMQVSPKDVYFFGGSIIGCIFLLYGQLRLHYLEIR